MADGAGDVSSSDTGPPRENEATVSSTNRSCRGCLYYSSIMREHGRNPICLGLSRNSDSKVYAVQSELEKEVTKNLRKFSDFKYACIGYSTHKELSSNPSSPSIEGPSELPNCVGLEFLADRKPTRHGVPAHPPPLPTSAPTMTVSDSNSYKFIVMFFVFRLSHFLCRFARFSRSFMCLILTFAPLRLL